MSVSVAVNGTVDWIDDRLAVGGRADATDENILRAHGIDAILCVETECPDYPPLPGLAVAHFCILDGGELSEKTLMSCLGTLLRWRAMGRTVLVHCGAGVSRASLIAAAYLAWRYDVPWHVAENLVRRKHPPALPNPVLVRQAMEHLNRWQLTAT